MSLDLNALAFLALIKTLAFLTLSYVISRLQQSLHWHRSSHNKPAVKHSQYICKHCDFEHLQTIVSAAVFLRSTIWSISCLNRSCFSSVFRPRPLVLRSFNLLLFLLPLLFWIVFSKAAPCDATSPLLTDYSRILLFNCCFSILLLMKSAFAFDYYYSLYY